MQFDGAPATSQLASLHLANVMERTVALALQPDGDSRALDLQRAIRGLCDEARRQGVRAEQLLVLLKKTWHARRELHHITREESAQRFDSVLTSCIEEYYNTR